MPLILGDPIVVAVPTAPARRQPAIEVYVAGARVSAITAMGSVRVNNTGSRSNADLVLYDKAGTWSPRRLSDVLIRVMNPHPEYFLGDGVIGDTGSGDGTWHHHVLFGGKLRKWNREMLGATPNIQTGSFSGDEVAGDSEVGDGFAGVFYPSRIVMACTDYSSDLNLRRPDTSYTSQTLKYIVDDLNSTILAGLGYTTTYVATGPTIAALDLLNKRKTAREAFDRLATITGYVWWIDESKNIHFQLPSDSMPGPIVISDTSRQFETFSPSFTDELYRNVQHVVKDDGTIVTRTDAAEVALYGEVENLEEPEDIASTGAAEEYGDGLLRRYGHPLVSASVVTREHGCKPGQTIPVFMPSMGISRTMIIDSVKTDIGNDGLSSERVIANIKYTLSLSEYGDRPEDFAAYFRRLVGKN